MTNSPLEEQLAIELMARTYRDVDGYERPLPKFVREHRFDAVRKWRFDFAWPEAKVAVEVEGGTWANGRHNRGDGYARDCEKRNAAVVAGWRVLHFTSDMVKDGRAFDTIRTILAPNAPPSRGLLAFIRASA